LLYVNDPENPSYSTATKEFGTLLERDYDLSVHHFLNESDNQKIMENKHDWIEDNIRNCEHFIFILSDRLLRLYNDGNSQERQDLVNEPDIDNTIDLTNYALKNLRMNGHKKCYFVSFSNEYSMYTNQIANLPGVLSRTRIFNIIKSVRLPNNHKMPTLSGIQFQELLSKLNVQTTRRMQRESVQSKRFLDSVKYWMDELEGQRRHVECHVQIWGDYRNGATFL